MIRKTCTVYNGSVAKKTFEVVIDLGFIREKSQGRHTSWEGLHNRVVKKSEVGVMDCISSVNCCCLD